MMGLFKLECSAGAVELVKSALRAKPGAEAKLAAMILASFPLMTRGGEIYLVSTEASGKEEMNFQFWLYGAMLVLTMLLACVGVLTLWRWLPFGRCASPLVIIHVQAVVAVPVADRDAGGAAAGAAGADEVRGAPLPAARDQVPAVAVQVVVPGVAVPVAIPAVAVPIAVARGAPLPAARGTFYATRKGEKLHVDIRCRAIRGRDIRRLEIEGHVDEEMLCKICAT